VSINVDDWIKYIDEQENLRHRNKKRVGINPTTGAKIEVAPVAGDCDIIVKGRWQHFLRYDNGVLARIYNPGLADPSNEVRVNVVKVAKHFGTDIDHDARGPSLNVWLYKTAE